MPKSNYDVIFSKREILSGKLLLMIKCDKKNRAVRCFRNDCILWLLNRIGADPDILAEKIRKAYEQIHNS